jgi:hypothetical protein
MIHARCGLQTEAALHLESTCPWALNGKHKEEHDVCCFSLESCWDFDLRASSSGQSQSFSRGGPSAPTVLQKTCKVPCLQYVRMIPNESANLGQCRPKERMVFSLHEWACSQPCR